MTKIAIEPQDIVKEIREIVRKALFEMPWIDVQGDPDEFACGIDKLLETKLGELVTLVVDRDGDRRRQNRAYRMATLGKYRSHLS